jgi:hypothetical protein
MMFLNSFSVLKNVDVKVCLKEVHELVLKKVKVKCTFCLVHILFSARFMWLLKFLRLLNISQQSQKNFDNISLRD